MHIKKGDQVKIIAGKDRGKSGTVMKVMPAGNAISVEGVNLYKKRVRPRRQNQKGETVMVVRPIAVSNAMVICRNCKKAVRVGSRLLGNQKVRYCKKCGSAI
ncbi:MAG: 50S ribosomal protein L24 [Parcubacteria group bacterium GW2011_GWB1_56_8]|nr:MAG: 50S ribosomal protein L24 [Parcubacteria group bacterium GW2011_GWB1_56_8]